MKKVCAGILLVAMVLVWSNTQATVTATGSINLYQGLSTDTKPTSSKVGSRFHEYDTGRDFISNGTTWSAVIIKTVKDTLTLSAPGNGVAYATAGYNRATVLYTVSGINSSVASALQVRYGNSGWTSVVADSTVVVVNGNYGLTYLGLAAADSVRYKWLTEGGGTSAVVVYNMALSQ